MKPRWMILWGLLFCLWMPAAGLCQEAGESRMDTASFETLRRPAALFDHDAHNQKAGLEECARCHHVWENGKLVPDESSEGTPCADCHQLAAVGDNGVSLANAYHTQCRSCHFDKGMGPVLCGQCHKKEGESH